jgi:hypothetical protein
MAYAFALAGNWDKRDEILKSLDEEAIKEGKTVFSTSSLLSSYEERQVSIWSMDSAVSPDSLAC